MGQDRSAADHLNDHLDAAAAGDATRSHALDPAISQQSSASLPLMTHQGLLPVLRITSGGNSFMRPHQ